MNKNFVMKKRKNVDIRVRLSTTFPTRARCKYCSGPPSDFYYIYNKVLWHDVKDFLREFFFYTNAIELLGNERQVPRNTRSVVTMNVFKHSIWWDNFDAKLHKLSSRSTRNIDDVTEYITCKCGKTNWAFSEKTVKRKPEIIQRRSRSFFPQKFHI